MLNFRFKVATAARFGSLVTIAESKQEIRRRPRYPGVFGRAEIDDDPVASLYTVSPPILLKTRQIQEGYALIGF